MAERRIEFGVHDKPKPAQVDGFTVVGRVMGDPLRVGDVFTEADGPRDRWDVPSSHVTEVALEVVEIRVFGGQLLDEAEAPYSAELLLRGVGVDHLADLVLLRANE